MPATLVFLALESCLGHAVLALGEARLLEPSERPAAVGVEVALLLGQRLVEGLVDERQRLAHRERLALGVEHLGVAGVDRHARADGGLREVHRRDVAALEVGERRGQLGLECGDELAARGGGRVGGARAADEDDAGGRALVPMPIMRSASLRAHRPSAADGKASVESPRRGRSPSRCWPCPSSLVALGLLEGVVDGDGKAGCACSARRCIACVMPSRKNVSAFSLLAVTIRRRDQFLGLGHSERGEEIRKDRLQRTAQPDVEEVRQVGVADVVVVGRVGRDHLVRRLTICVCASACQRMPTDACAGEAVSRRSAATFDSSFADCPTDSRSGFASAKSQVIGIAWRPKDV